MVAGICRHRRTGDRNLDCEGDEGGRGEAIREAKAVEKRKDDLKARMVAASIVLDLVALEGSVESVYARLFDPDRPIQQARNFADPQLPPSKAEALGHSVSDMTIELPSMLKDNLGRLHWLGHPTGQEMLLLMSIVFQSNAVLAKMTRDVLRQGRRNLADWLDQIGPQLDLSLATLRQTHAKVEALHSQSDAPVSVTRQPWWTRPPR